MRFVQGLHFIRKVLMVTIQPLGCKGNPQWLHRTTLADDDQFPSRDVYMSY